MFSTVCGRTAPSRTRCPYKTMAARPAVSTPCWLDGVIRASRCSKLPWRGLPPPKTPGKPCAPCCLDCLIERRPKTDKWATNLDADGHRGWNDPHNRGDGLTLGERVGESLNLHRRMRVVGEFGGRALLRGLIDWTNAEA